MVSFARARWWVVGWVGLLGFASGCDDSKGSGGTSNADCPGASEDVPDDGAGLMGACCYRKSNADTPNAPEFRLAAMRIQAPAAIAKDFISDALAAFLDNETFNWLLRMENLDGAATFTTGYGDRNDDHTFSFRAATDSLAPATGVGSLSGNTFTAEPAEQTIIVPSLDPVTLEPAVEFALTNVTIQRAVLSEERTCVGRRTDDGYTTGEGDLAGFVTVEAASTARMTIKPVLDTSLCDLLADQPSTQWNPATACSGDQAEWPQPPNSLCEGVSCQQDPGDGSVCSKSTCNAWYLEATFAAQGVEITDGTSTGDDAGTDAGDGG